MLPPAHASPVRGLEALFRAYPLMCAAADPTRRRADGSPLTRVSGGGADRGACRSPEQAAHHGAGHGALRSATRGLEGELPALGLICETYCARESP
jgi:hypothetical protein